MADAFEILSDCASCKVEGAVVELVDPGRARGVAVLARCRLCLREERLGVEVAPARVPADAASALQALARWAAEEGETDLERFCEGSMGGLPSAEVARRLVAGEVVPTNFDVLSWLFGGMSGGVAPPEPPRAADPAPIPSNEPPPSSVQAPQGSAFRPARAFASVLLADGVLRPDERDAVDNALAVFGYPPMRPEDLKVWRPHELGRPEDPGPWIVALVGLVWSDGQRDESEWRVLREIARAWAFPMSRLEQLDARERERHAPLHRRAWTSLRRLFVVEQP